MKKALKICEVIFYAVIVILLLWVAISYIEVFSKNLSPNPQYSPINLFALLVGKE